MRWRPFRFGGARYDLSHVHPSTCHYVQAAKGDNPERIYTVDVTFSHHCFTRGFKQNEVPDPAMIYADARGDERIFDFSRYALSKHLPGIVSRLGNCRCYHTGYGNYFSIQLVDANNVTVEYDVFFAVSRASRKDILNLYVQSAYTRDDQHNNPPRLNASRRPNLKPISFQVILFNVAAGIHIKVPK